MRFGPTSLRINSVLAKGLHRPRLRPDLIASEQVVAGETSYVVKIPESGTFSRYGAFEFELLKLCDGSRTPAEIAEEISRRHPREAVSEEQVSEFIEGADPNTWERSLGEKNLAILERIREERKSRVDRTSLLYITFSAWASDRTLTRIYPYLRWLFTPGFVVFSVLLFVLTAVIVVGDYPRIRQDTIQFYTFTDKTAYDLWIFWILLFVISGIHEFGHGLTCKHFGGEVPSMGILLIYFTPAFYTDCTEVCMFDRTSKRMWTIFAGLWIEMVVCGIATIIWAVSPPGSFTADICYKTLLLTGVSGLFINLNPLMRLDGYYALSQYLEMENLREDSFAFLKAWVRRYIFRQDMDLPPATRRKRRIFLTYSTAAAVYGFLLLLTVAGFLKNILVRKFGTWGYPLTLLVLYLILRTRLQKWLPGWMAGLRTAKETFMAWRMTRGQQFGALALGLLLVAVPTHTKVSTEFILEPGARAEVRAPVAGMVASVGVHEGQPVRAGDVLATLRNPELDAQLAAAQSELLLAQRGLLEAEARNDAAGIARYSQEQRRWAAALSDAQTKVAGLVLRAPIAGIVATPQIIQRVGEYLAQGDSFGVVADRSSMKARVLVRDWELEDVRVGAPVKLKVRAYSLEAFSGTVEQILPAAAADQPVAQPQKLERRGQEVTNYFAVVLRLDNPNQKLIEGMTGLAKIYGDRSPVIWHLGRLGWRWLRSQIW